MAGEELILAAVLAVILVLVILRAAIKVVREYERLAVGSTEHPGVRIGATKKHRHLIESHVIAVENAADEAIPTVARQTGEKSAATTQYTFRARS